MGVIDIKDYVKNLHNLKSKLVVVTGASKGIGEVTAHGFAVAGANVVVVGTNVERTHRVAQEIASAYSVDTHAEVADVSRPDQVHTLFDSIKQKYKKIDVLFNNAGVCIHQDSLHMTYEQWKYIIDINLGGVFLCSQAAAKIMIPNGGGSIINMASISGTIVNLPQYQSAYNASKAGVIQLSKSLAVEWEEYGIRVNSISPGYINTPMASEVDEALKKEWMSRSLQKRMADPTELVGIVLYLSGDGAKFTTGADFIIDGGYTCV